MTRQKQMHDTRASYEKFGVGDNVYVYFPVKKVVTSSKFTSFWRGPYQIMGKLSAVLYKVDCGRNKTTQVIHCNRIKKCREQTLTGEAEEAEVGNEGMEDTYDDTDVHFPDPAINDRPITEVDDLLSGEKRHRRPPVWAKDYVFGTVAPGMSKAQPKLSQPTPLYPECQHIGQLICRSVSRPNCEQCGITFKRGRYLNRHMKRRHQADDEIKSKPSRI